MHLRTIVEGLPSCFAWNDVKKTVVSLGIFNVFFLIYTISDCSILQLISSAAFYGIIFSIVYTFILSFIQKSEVNVQTKSQNYEFISQALIQQVIVKIVSIVNGGRNFFIRCTEDTFELLQFLFVCYVFSCIGGWFTATTYVWLFTDFLFAITYVQKTKGINVADYIDSFGDIVIGSIKFAQDLIPKYVPKQ